VSVRDDTDLVEIAWLLRERLRRLGWPKHANLRLPTASYEHPLSDMGRRSAPSRRVNGIFR
jgi:hypothetical protein